MKIKNTAVESTPFAHVEITDKVLNGRNIAWFQLYAAVRAGTYGYQVCYRGALEDAYFEGKTSGCGYCKATAGTEACLSIILGKHVSLGRDAASLFRDYATGGNAYKCSLAQLKRLVIRKETR